MIISKNLIDILSCPKTGSKLLLEDNSLVSKERSYPIINGIPILIDEDKSIFKINTFIDGGETTFDNNRLELKRLAKKYLPSISKNLKAKENYSYFKKLLIKDFKKPKVLVIGGGVSGYGIELLQDSNVEIIETDVSFGPRTKIIADAHCLPFKSESFDGVIVQAVLEHVLDPNLCVQEITRVIKNDGYVYAETPFMQQVHMAPYDFTRFTYLGHINLFSHYSVIKSGAAIGPGSALAWSYLYFMMSFSSNRLIKYFLVAFSFLTSFWLKYFDYLLINKNEALDAASAYYFIFKKLKEPLTKDEIINSYKGAKL